MREVVIKKNPNGDTRTAKKGVSFVEFEHANNMHRSDVYNVLCVLARELKDKGLNHDWTKVCNVKEFYNDFLDTLNKGTDFTQSKWYKLHVSEERHHLTSKCPEDVNLLDVIEMITDCVCAGLARSGEIRELEINDEILQKATINTVKLIESMIQVVD